MKLFRHLFALACLLFVSMPALADNKISVDPVNIANNEVTYIPVVLTNTDEIGAVQFDIQLPDFMEFPDKVNPIYSDRLDGHMPGFNGYRCSMMAFSGKPFRGNDGVIVSLPVKVKEGTSAGTEGKIAITNIVISSLGATSGGTAGTATEYPQDDFEVEATFQKQNVNVEVSFSADPAELVLNPGASARIDLNFKSNTAISGSQASFQMPDGLSIPQESAILNNSIFNGMISVTPNPNNCYTIAYLGYGAPQANEGTFLTFDVVADDTYAAESAEIKVFDIIISDMNYMSHEAADFTIAVTSSVAAYTDLTNALNGVEDKISTVRKEIETKYADVKDQFPLDDYTKKVEELRGRIEAAYADGTLNAKEADLAAEITALGESLDQVLVDAEKAQRDFEAAAANQAAHDEMLKQLDKAQKAYTDTIAAIAKECPHVADRFKGEEIAKMIDKLATDIEKYNEEGTCVDYLEDVKDRVVAIGEDLAALKDAAKAEEKAHQAEAANKAAHEEMLEQLGMAEKAFTDTIASIKDTCPNVADQFKGEEIDAEIKALAEDIKKYDEEGTCVDNLQGVKDRVVAIGEDLAALKDAAVAAEKAHQAEADNKAAHEEMLKQLGMAEKAFTDTIASIAEDCPHVADQFKGEEIDAEIKALAEDIKKYNEAGTCVDNLEDVKARVAAIGEDLAALKAAATAAEEEYKSNKSVYDTMMEQVKVARLTLEDALAAIDKECPNVKDQFKGEEIAKMIDALEADIEKYNTEGTCADNVETVNDAIAAIGEAIAQLQADATAAEEKYKSEQLQAANQAAYDRVNDKLDASRTALAAAVAEIADKYPNIKEQFTGEEITADIEEVAAELASLYEQTLCAEEEEALNAKVAAIDEAIAGYVAEAQAAQEKFELDLRNRSAYNGVIAQIDALQAELDAAVAHVNEAYPDAPVQSYIYTAQSAINDVREGADEAYDAATENGTSFNYTFDAETIKALIAEIEEAARMLGINEIFGDDLDASAFCDVFTTEGRLVLKQIPVAEIREHLAQGFYIVLVNDKSYKLAIK